MKLVTLLLLLCATMESAIFAAPPAPQAFPANRVLLIDTSSTPVAAGKATLTIGELQRTNGIYRGDYKVKLFPYFYKNDKGRLAIVVSDETLAEVRQGKTVTIQGTATSGKTGKVRHITATATPADPQHGQLKLWFTAGERKLVFEPPYRFVAQAIAAVPAPAPHHLANRL